VGNTNMHYVKYINVYVNGKWVAKQRFFSQQYDSYQEAVFNIPDLKAKDVLLVIAHCSRKGRIDKSKAVLIFNYERLNPSISWEFSRALKDAGSSYEVVKKRILLKALEKSGLENVKFEDLKGHIGVVFTENDAIKATQVTYKFSESQGDQIKVLTGRLDGKIYSQDDLKEISKLPTEDVMRAQFVGLLESPMSSLLSVLENSITGVLYCLEEKGKKSN